MSTKTQVCIIAACLSVVLSSKNGTEKKAASSAATQVAFLERTIIHPYAKCLMHTSRSIIQHIKKVYSREETFNK